MKHSRTLQFVAAALTAAAPALLAARSAQDVTASAAIKGAGITGTVELREVGNAEARHYDPRSDTGTRRVEITATIEGLTPGAHGFHLHAVGTCEPDFAAAGGHFDPGPAGNTDADANHPYHMGDMPNLVADASGKATLKTMTTRVTLSAGPLSVFDADGTAIIVHGNPDQGTTGAPKSGLSGGPRVACGVIQKK
jgi:Cu-Zn family superoxide dismutase